MDERIKALKEWAGEDAEIEEQGWDHWGLPVYMVDGQEVAIGTKEEAKEAAKANIEESAWAFNASFILNHCDLPYELEECLEGFQQAKCEGANEAILALIDKCGDRDQFVDEAIDADGIGHFLDQWDGEGDEANDYLIFRV